MSAPLGFFSGAPAAQNGVRRWCPDGYIYPSGANAPLRLRQWRGAASRGHIPHQAQCPGNQNKAEENAMGDLNIDVDRSVYAVNFSEVPELGTRIRFGRSKRGSGILIDIIPYQRKNGEASFVLTWQRNNGRTGTSGLRSKSINWKSA